MEEGGQSKEYKDKDMSGASCVTHIIESFRRTGVQSVDCQANTSLHYVLKG